MSKKTKKVVAVQSRAFSVVLEMEKPPRIKAVEDVLPRLRCGERPCPLGDFFIRTDKYCPMRYPAISPQGMRDRIKAFSASYGGAPYWAIVHDKDGTRTHCHLCVELPLKKTKMGALRLLKYALGLEEDRISVNVERGDGLIYAIRYLRHLDEDLRTNEEEKYPYSSAMVWTNEPERMEEAFSLKVRAQGATTRQLIDVVARCERLTDVIVELGIEAYRKYRFVIMDLWAEKRVYIDQRVGFRDNMTA